MKRAAVVTSIVLSLLGTQSARCMEAKLSHSHKKNTSEPETQTLPEIQVADGDWGDARPEEIAVVLNAVAAELIGHFPGRHLDPIVVSPSEHGPVVLYQKAPDNKYQVLLGARDRRWAEYVYEFSHELFHILAHYEYHAPPHTAPHQWFEETLCESVSLYTLKRFSLTWDHSPQLAEWRSYAPSLRSYTSRAISDGHRRLPRNVSFEQWFRTNGPTLVSHPYQREKNDLMSNLFLPVLEQNADWRAIAYLNVDASDNKVAFRDFLARWYRKTPTDHKAFVERTMQVFQFNKPVDDNALPIVRPQL